MKKIIISISLMLSSCETDPTNELHYSVNTNEPDWSYLGDVVYESVDMSKVGEYLVVYKLNEEEKEVKVNIVDIHDPVIKLNGGDVYLNKGEEYIEPGYTVTDNYDTNLEAEVNSSNLDINTIGEYEIIYTTTDFSGNSNTVTRKVHVIEETVLELIGADVIEIEQGDEYIDPGYSINKDLEVEVISNVNNEVAGTYTVKYIVEDIELIRTVNVIYNETILTLNGDSTINLEVGSEYIEHGASVNKDIEILQEGVVDTNTPGTYYIKYKALDKQIVRTINVIDREENVLLLNGEEELHLEVGSEYIEQGAYTNNDNEIIIEGNVDTNTLGIYNITYKANGLEVVRTIYVEDSIAPKITLNGENMILRLHESYDELGAIASDNYDNLVDVFIGNNLNISEIGTYFVTYTATDSSGNTSEVKREVKVIDDTKPSITLNGEETVHIAYGEQYTELGVVTSDNYSEVNVEIIGEVEETPGIYNISYIATDSSGNVSQTERIVIVEEEQFEIFYIGDIVWFSGTYYSDSYGEGNSGNIEGKYVIDRVVNAPYPYLIRPINGTSAYGWTDSLSLTMSEATTKVFNSVDDLIINQNLLDSDHKKVGSLMTPTYIVIHNTANDASAYNEIAYLHNPNNTTYTSFHFAVDESEIWQGVDLAYNAWHAGDGGGEDSYNRNSIGIEIARSTHPDLTLRDRATNNAAILAAKMIMDYDIPIENVIAHYHSDGKWDPADIFERMGWEKFLELIESYLQ